MIYLSPILVTAQGLIVWQCCVPHGGIDWENQVSTEEESETLHAARRAAGKPVDMQGRRPLIVGISGASGVIFGLRILEVLCDAGIETHLVMSKTAELTFAYETNAKLAEVKALATVVHPIDDMTAAISSGSFRTSGMVVAPCSVRSMSEIASGVATTLLTRAADVTLKEHRRLVLMVRETPLHLGHLRSLTQLAEMGAVIAPPVPAFYSHPASIGDLVDHTVGRVMDLFDIDLGMVPRWGEVNDLKRRPASFRKAES